MQLRQKELKSLLDSGAIRILSKEEFKEFMRNHPNTCAVCRQMEAYGRVWSRTFTRSSLRPLQQSSFRENPKYEVPLTIWVIDAKSVFDSTSFPEQQNRGEDDRAALEAAIIYESLSRLQAQL